MAADVIREVPMKAESFTLRAFEARLREHLEDRLQVRTRFADLGSTRAFLVSPADRDRPKGLVIDVRASAAERIYLYVHAAAHIALGHNIPLITIVEGDDEEPSDGLRHDQADRLARAMWWRRGSPEMVSSLPSAQRSRVLRPLLAHAATRSALHVLLRGMRSAFYGSGLARIAGDGGLTSWLRQALAATAVVDAAPQLAERR
ncbi:MAG: hypothetical protein ACRDGT_04350 [Candidatus Limnocylindria bacterium]